MAPAHAEEARPGEGTVVEQQHTRTLTDLTLRANAMTAARGLCVTCSEPASGVARVVLKINSGLASVRHRSHNQRISKRSHD